MHRLIGWGTEAASSILQFVAGLTFEQGGVALTDVELVWLRRLPMSISSRMKTLNQDLQTLYLESTLVKENSLRILSPKYPIL